jgi:hypothetical protein
MLTTFLSLRVNISIAFSNIHLAGGPEGSHRCRLFRLTGCTCLFPTSTFCSMGCPHGCVCAFTVRTGIECDIDRVFCVPKSSKLFALRNQRKINDAKAGTLHFVTLRGSLTPPFMDLISHLILFTGTVKDLSSIPSYSLSGAFATTSSLLRTSRSSPQMCVWVPNAAVARERDVERLTHRTK